MRTELLRQLYRGFLYCELHWQLLRAMSMRRPKWQRKLPLRFWLIPGDVDAKLLPVRTARLEGSNALY